MSLKARLTAEIAQFGPMTVADYMSRCLNDPQDGYYAVRPALGEAGDFITAPLVSQMFGELLGLWAAQTWAGLGRPDRVILVEAGPGDGTLMADALRAARLAPDFLRAAELVLLETSPPLARAQKVRLADSPLPPRWIETLDDLPTDAPILLVANELLDCLPARQFVRGPGGWAERLVGLDRDGALAFGLSSRPLDWSPPPAEPGALVERSPAQEAWAEALGRRIADQGGAALLIDYGRAEPGFGDTLQALQDHHKVDPLAEPGHADLTVHADFPAVASAARRGGTLTCPLLTQGELLRRLGIEGRAQTLRQSRPDQADVITRQLARLIGATQMGTLFKALALYAPGPPPPPGFDEAPCQT